VDATVAAPVQLRPEAFYLVDGEIQITPCNTTYLFGILKERVTRIVDQLTQKSQCPSGGENETCAAAG
jgi:hypothetical protein